MLIQELLGLYREAKVFCELSFRQELDWARRVNFTGIDETHFFCEYVWVVLNSGFRFQVAKRYFEAFVRSGDSPETMRLDTLMKHEGKRKAIRQAQNHYKQWFHRLRESPESKRLAVLDSLPYIGSVTKYHLARNLGLDFAKPDVHLVRLAKRFGFKDANEMCTQIASEVKERVGVVDLILWRYSEQGQA